MKRLFYFFTVLSFSFISCDKDDCNKPDACSLIPDAGPCEAYMVRYFYNNEKGKCEEFIYGGCNGTVPFETLEECWECECSKRLE